MRRVRPCAFPCVFSSASSSKSKQILFGCFLSRARLFSANEVRTVAAKQLQIILSIRSFILIGGPALHVLHHPLLLAQAAQRHWLRRMVRLNILRLPRTATNTHVAERFRDLSHMIVERIQTVPMTCRLGFIEYNGENSTVFSVSYSHLSPRSCQSFFLHPY